MARKWDENGHYRQVPNVYDQRFRTAWRIDVMAYGAIGDGVHDDTDALQKALDACGPDQYNTISLPAGKYRTTRPLYLKMPQRPKTDGTEGFGLRIEGQGIYDTGIIYEGTDYAIESNQEMAEAFHLVDFYINHKNGGGVRVPQGAHQMFERFFSSACAAGYYGVKIEGDRAGLDPTGGWGSYMVSFRSCRFWSERGYLGTGVRVEDSVLCTLFDNCFFSRAVTNRPHLELFRSTTIHILNTAFERSELGDNSMAPSEMRAMNAAITAPLIVLDQCYAVSIIDSHVEYAFPNFIEIKGNTSGVRIDGCNFSHYAINEFNPQKGYILTVDPASTSSRDIMIGRRNYRKQTNHLGGSIGPAFLDPIGCVVVEDHYDYTPYQGSQELELMERRTVPRIGMSGQNLIKNPSFYALTKNAVPLGLDLVEGQFTFTQLDYKGGVNIKQTGAAGPKYRMRMYTTEVLDKHDVYTLIMVGRNNSGTSGQVWFDLAGDGNDFPLIIPSGNEMFTLKGKMTGRLTGLVDMVMYNPMDFDVYAVYLVPGIVSEIPYGSEMMAASRFTATRADVTALQITPVPELPAAGWDYRGMVVYLIAEGQEDALKICKRKADGSFAWFDL